MKFFALLILGSLMALQSRAQPGKNHQLDSVMPCLLKEGVHYTREKDQIYLLIENQVRFLRSRLHYWNQDSGMKLITKSGSVESNIRPNTTFAGDLSFLYRFGHYSEKVVGISRKDLLQNELIPVLRYLVRTHKTGDLKTADGKSWGDAWQSAHWASSLANAAWWAWKDLPEEIRQGARRVVAHEADRIAGTVPPHQVRLDSKSEENAWNSQILSAALILMPTDPRFKTWEKSLKQWALSSYLRAADSTSGAIVDGEPVSKQYTGANIHDDFTLENHDIVHPDYMGAWIMNAGNDLDYLLTGRKPLQAFLYNLPQIYDNQKRLYLPDGGYLYPNGQDWALFRNPDWITDHATAVARFNDPGALFYLHMGLETAEKMQARNKDGAIYGPGENYFASAQPHVAYWLVQSWLVLQYAQKQLRPQAPKPGINYYGEGKIIINRTKKVMNSAAWGERPMLELMPIAKDHIMSPDQRNGVGRISVNDTLQPIIVKSVEVKHTKNSFILHLILEHGGYVKAAIICQSDADGKLHISEKLTALKNCHTDYIHTLSFGILNNPNWVYESGERRLKLGKGVRVVKAASGKTYQANTKEAKVDGMDFQLNKPSTISYHIAAKMKNSRYTDLIILNDLSSKRVWKKGELISENKLTISVK